MGKHFFLSALMLLVFILKTTAQEYNFSELSLKESIEIALDNNLDLHRSYLELVSSEVNLLESRGQRLPSFATRLSSGYNWGRNIDPTTNLFVENIRIGNVNAQASANITLFAGRQISNSIQQAMLNLETGQYNVKAARNNISLNVINLFLNLVFAKEQIKLAESQVKTTEEQLKRISLLVEAGSLPTAEKLEMEAQKATNMVDLVNATNQVSIAKLNLAQALQIPFSENFDIVIPDMVAEDFSITQSSIDQIFAVALENLPEIKAADLQVNSAEYGIKIAKGGFYPSVGLNANAFTNYTDRPFNQFGDIRPFMQQFDNNFAQSALIFLNIPIFSNYSNNVNLQRAKVQKQLREIERTSTRNQVRQDIETAYTGAIAAKQTYLSSVTRVKSLTEAFRMAQQRFDAGAINSVDFQLSQNNLFSSQIDLTNAKYEYIFRVKVLDFYLGNAITL